MDLKKRSYFILGLFVIVIVIIFSFRLENVPPLWWDEGWNLSVARNWVELGHYGLLRNGEYRSDGFAGHFPTIVPVALSFRIFGVGVWQGRLPGILFTLGSLFLIYYLAARLYTSAIALGTLGVLLLMTGAAQLHPLLIGRQVLGEMPAMFYLLSGYTFLLLALDGPAWLIVFAMCAWGIAITTKAQVLPFWLVSLSLPVLITMYRRWWRQAVLIALGVGGSFVITRLLPLLQASVINVGAIPAEPIIGLISITAFVLDGAVRLAAVLNALTFGLLTLLGIGYALFRSLYELRGSIQKKNLYISRLSLIVLASSWFMWYLIFGMYYNRYMFPAVFVGSIFSSALLYKLTDGFNLKSTVRYASSTIIKRVYTGRTVGALFAVLIVAIMTSVTLMTLIYSFIFRSNNSAYDVAQYINSQTPDESVVESYESELYFMLDRHYHYPPDYVHVQIIQRDSTHPDTSIDYDPLTADPDYLVVGPFGRQYRVYDPLLSNGEFGLLVSFPPYEIFERVRK